MTTTSFEPVTSDERMRTLDVVRGAALLGIALMNIVFSGLPFAAYVGSSRVDLQACKLEYSIVSPK